MRCAHVSFGLRLRRFAAFAFARRSVAQCRLRVVSDLVFAPFLFSGLRYACICLLSCHVSRVSPTCRRAAHLRPCRRCVFSVCCQRVSPRCVFVPPFVLCLVCVLAQCWHLLSCVLPRCVFAFVHVVLRFRVCSRFESVSPYISDARRVSLIHVIAFVRLPHTYGPSCACLLVNPSFIHGPDSGGASIRWCLIAASLAVLSTASNSSLVTRSFTLCEPGGVFTVRSTDAARKSSGTGGLGVGLTSYAGGNPTPSLHATGSRPPHTDGAQGRTSHSLADRPCSQSL